MTCVKNARSVENCFLAESVFARCLSSLKNDRVAASKKLEGPKQTKYTGDKTVFIEDIRLVILRY